MRILWLPHTPDHYQTWEGSRPFHLFQYLSKKHDLHYISWNTRPDPSWLKIGGYQTTQEPFGRRHLIQLGPNIPRLGHEPVLPYNVLFNQFFFQKAIKKILSEIEPDTMVFSSSYHFTGFPFIPEKIPVFYDYLDQNPGHVDKVLIKKSRRVIAVSDALSEIARGYGKSATTISNGIDPHRFHPSGRDSAKKKLGLSKNVVVSLIGMTCSLSLYFVEAIAKIQKVIPNLALIVVGTGGVKEAIQKKAAALSIPNLIMPGFVPHALVHEYFQATDVGLYPGKDDYFYRTACPIKILEYTAVGAQVVSSPVEMFRNGWPNVRIAEPSSEAFESAILQAIDQPRPCRDMSEYTWPLLSRKFEQTLGSLSN